MACTPTQPQSPHKLSLPDGSTLSLARPLIMGILNVTPDSFSDGGTYLSQQDARTHALDMLMQGADILDVGGESTRPGAEPVSAQEQIRRVLPAIEAAAAQIKSSDGPRPSAISIDSTSSIVAQAALTAGATLLNDVSAGRHDPLMFKLAADSGAPIVLMHMQGKPATMQKQPHYDNVVEEVKNFLLAQATLAQEQGVKRSQIILDPGIGFGKTLEHNLSLMAHLHVLVATGYPVMLGASRKRFLGALCQRDASQPPVPDSLIGATAATTAAGVSQGVNIFRVHDVLPNRQAADVAWVISQTKS